MATENILMACVKCGGDRQELHEVIRQHSQAAARRVKMEGAENDLLERLANDPALPMSRAEIDAALDLKQFVGRAPEQVVEFVDCELRPVLERHAALLGTASNVRV